MKVFQIKNCKLSLNDSNNFIESIIVDNLGDLKPLFVDYLSVLEEKDIDDSFFKGKNEDFINYYLDNFLSFIN